jgi:hypothetical protein
MTFVVDSNDWDFNNLDSFEINQLLDRFLGLVMSCSERHEVIYIGDELQIKKLYQEYSLWDLWNPDSSIELRFEIRQELSAWLGRVQNYNDLDNMVEIQCFEFSFDDDTEKKYSPDVSWVFYNKLNGNNTACLGIKTNGEHSVCIDSEKKSHIYWINDEVTHLNYWRTQIHHLGIGADELQRYSGNAFPTVYFHKNFWKQLNDLDGGYISAREDVFEMLKILNDHGEWIFFCSGTSTDFDADQIIKKGSKASNQTIINRFIKFNLNASPEKPNVFKNKTCRDSRTIEVDGRNIYCEWHIKIQLHRNRIHIHEGIEQSKFKTIIAIASNHLPLP